MNKILLLLVAVIMLSARMKDLPGDQYKELQKAYKAHNYFKLDDLVKKTDPAVENAELLLYRAKTGYIFDKPRESDSLINILFNKYAKAFDDTVIADLYYMRAVNEDRLENYKNSYEYGDLVISKYSRLYDTAFIKELKDDNDVRLLLSNSPKMEITRIDDTRIKIRRDFAGLMNVPVVIGSDTIEFIFDTGANMPVIISSLARKYGFKALEGKIKVMAVTGKRIDADIALVNLNIGNIRIKNSPFIVFPDSVLTFAKGAYVIKGVIGFPIIKAFGELIFKNDKELIIPKIPEKCNGKNFALDGAMPVILVNYKNDSLPFHFDTGADKTFLYPSFFKKYKNDVLQHSKKITQKMGGAGGEIDVETYVLDSALLTAGNVQTRLDSLRILTKSLMSEQDQYFYGNFGQDFIKQYGVMKLNFEYMNINFSK